MPSSGHHNLFLTDRDSAILQAVFSYGGCGIRHLQVRFFPDVGTRSACYARVARLVTAGYLQSDRLPSTTGQGSGPYYLTVGVRARPLLAKLLNLTPSELRRQSRAISPFI